MKPSALLPLLSVPGTDHPVHLKVTHVAGNEPWSGWLENDSGEVVGVLDRFRFEFVDFDPKISPERKALAARAPLPAMEPVKIAIDPFDPRVRWRGRPIEISDYLRGFQGADPDEAIVFTSDAPALEVLLHAHGWSGIAEVRVNGARFQIVDLFNRENAIQRRILIPNPSGGENLIEIRSAGRSHPESQGRQFLLEGILEHTGQMETPVLAVKENRNRGGAFNPAFLEMLDALGPDTIALDVGGGKRQLADPRYLNLEYSRFEEPHLLGDATKLPFKSNSIDLVYTAAVLEHVEDPLSMGREIHRVTRPGGTVLANSAFMQPIHSEGQHFFNLTPYGIDLVFKQFEERKIWTDVAFDFTIRWMINVLNVRGRLPDKKLDDFISIAAEIAKMIPEGRGDYVASGVWLTGRKKKRK